MKQDLFKEYRHEFEPGKKERYQAWRAAIGLQAVDGLERCDYDPENETELTAAIEALTKEKTIIMIAHRLKTVRHADQIFVIDNGQISQKGTHEELLRQEGIYKTFIENRQEAVSWKIAAI